jgi:D-serine deaminase-like pyridoxal phosphate-dependent protein
LLKSTLESPAISIYGFYCHAGNSYASKSLPEASSFLSDEVNAVNLASQLALDLLGSSPSASRHTHPFVLSVGSTPTAHAFSSTAVSKLASLLNGTLELHAGNYPFCDLQQLATSLIPPTSIAQRIIASVISYYPGRGENDSDEAMCDAGAIAMSKDTGPWPGFGDVIRIHRPRAGGSSGASEGWQENGWRLGRMSQEHGIMVRKDPSIPIPEEERLELGAVVEIVGQHACLIAAAYPWYYVVEDGGDKVVDVWVPWKGW